MAILVHVGLTNMMEMMRIPFLLVLVVMSKLASLMIPAMMMTTIRMTMMHAMMPILIDKRWGLGGKAGRVLGGAWEGGGEERGGG